MTYGIDFELLITNIGPISTFEDQLPVKIGFCIFTKKSDHNCGRDSATVFTRSRGRRDFIIYANESKNKRAQLDIYRTNWIKFG